MSSLTEKMRSWNQTQVPRPHLVYFHFHTHSLTTNSHISSFAFNSLLYKLYQLQALVGRWVNLQNHARICVMIGQKLQSQDTAQHGFLHHSRRKQWHHSQGERANNTTCDWGTGSHTAWPDVHSAYLMLTGWDRLPHSRSFAKKFLLLSVTKDFSALLTAMLTIFQVQNIK